MTVVNIYNQLNLSTGDYPPFFGWALSNYLKGLRSKSRGFCRKFCLRTAASGPAWVSSQLSCPANFNLASHTITWANFFNKSFSIPFSISLSIFLSIYMQTHVTGCFSVEPWLLIQTRRKKQGRSVLCKTVSHGLKGSEDTTHIGWGTVEKSQKSVFVLRIVRQRYYRAWTRKTGGGAQSGGPVNEIMVRTYFMMITGSGAGDDNWLGGQQEGVTESQGEVGWGYWQGHLCD